MLDQSRQELQLAVAEGKDLKKVQDAAKVWFKDLKEWEGKETFERAFKDNRMTARSLDAKSAPKKLAVNNEKDPKTKTAILLDGSLQGIIARLDPANFIAKKKNELGLHDLSGTLLRGDRALSKQMFKSTGWVVFMPLPLEEDLKTLFLVSTLAKKNRDSDLYKEYVEMRASLTRIKYGSDNDMAVGFLNITKMKPGSDTETDGREHIRYGMGSIAGGPLSKELLDLRTQNALNYKTAIALSNKTEENNEVIIAYRKHAGVFPMIGFPTGKPGEFRLANTAPVGLLKDDGTVEYAKQ